MARRAAELGIQHVIQGREDKGVALIGGPDFGILGEGYLRLSYANSEESILRAIDRMDDFLAAR